MPVATAFSPVQPFPFFDLKKRIRVRAANKNRKKGH